METNSAFQKITSEHTSVSKKYQCPLNKKCPTNNTLYKALSHQTKKIQNQKKYFDASEIAFKLSYENHKKHSRTSNSSPPSMRRCSNISFRSHIGPDVADHTKTSSRRRNWYAMRLTYLRRLCDVSLVRK